MGNTPQQGMGTYGFPMISNIHLIEEFYGLDKLGILLGIDASDLLGLDFL